MFYNFMKVETSFWLLESSLKSAWNKLDINLKLDWKWHMLETSLETAWNQLETSLKQAYNSKFVNPLPYYLKQRFAYLAKKTT